MIFRLYKESDEDALDAMLADERIPVVYRQFRNSEVTTLVMVKNKEPIGFLTWNEQHGSLALVHLCVARAKRTNEIARTIARKLTEVMKVYQLKTILVGVPESNPSVYKFIKYWFKNARVYNLKPGMLFMKAEVY